MRANLEIGKIYKNKNDSAYKCIGQISDGFILERVTDSWTLKAHGVCMYENGTIEWDYSTGGEWTDKERLNAYIARQYQ